MHLKNWIYSKIKSQVFDSICFVYLFVFHYLFVQQISLIKPAVLNLFDANAKQLNVQHWAQKFRAAKTMYFFQIFLKMALSMHSSPVIKSSSMVSAQLILWWNSY